MKLYEALSDIISYYDDLRCGNRLPSIDEQSRAKHENTMFGRARKLLEELKK